MRRSSVSVCARLVRAVSALFAVGALASIGLAATASPASAYWNTLAGSITVDCIVPGPNHTYRAVFGYDNTAGPDSIPVGRFNALTPRNLNGNQVTTFHPGTHRSAFATPPVANSVAVSWTIGEQISATATAESPGCDAAMVMPAEIDETEPVLILAGGLLLVVTLLGVRGARKPLVMPVSS